MARRWTSPPLVSGSPARLGSLDWLVVEYHPTLLAVLDAVSVYTDSCLPTLTTGRLLRWFRCTRGGLVDRARVMGLCGVFRHEE